MLDAPEHRPPRPAQKELTLQGRPTESAIAEHLDRHPAILGGRVNGGRMVAAGLPATRYGAAVEPSPAHVLEPDLPIETDRLTLRAFGPGDFDAVFAMQSRPDVARFLYWDARTEEEVRQSLAMKIAATAIRAEEDTLFLAAELRTSGELVGDVVLHWTSEQHLSGEIGFIVHPDHQGHGYATEASRVLLELAFEHLRLHRVYARVEPRNVASARVLEKLGMRREAHLVENEFVKDEWQSELVYAMLRREWEAGASG
jgi:RimJ/RimL family protein N-acetyltransferase